MKNNFFLLFAILLTTTILMGCSKDEDEQNMPSSLTLNGVAIKINDLEGEYDPEGSWDRFTFWVNNALDETYIQATVSYDAKFIANEDITDKCDILINTGDDWANVVPDMPNTSYRSGKLIIENFDFDNRKITLRFDNYKYISDHKNVMELNGTLNMPFTIVQYGTGE